MGFRDDIEARTAKRNTIRNKISILSRKISEAREIMDGLRDCQRNIINITEDWENTYSSFQTVPINADVVVIDVFEGVIAEAMGGEIPEVAEKMNNTCGLMKSLCSNIAEQIKRLQEYIEKLQQQIQSLYMELSAI